MIILGVDIGGTGCKGALVNTDDGKLVSDRIRIETPQPATPEAIAKTLKELVSRFDYQGPIGCGFPSRILKGVVKTASNIDDSWIDIKVEELFTKTIGQPCYVANDADVAGLCELKYGSGSKYQNGTVLFLTIGTGIGSAIFVEGKLMPNTEFGHLKYKGDIAERYCSGVVKEREDLKWKEWGDRFNGYLKYIDFLLCPDLIVLGGGTSKKFEKYKDRITIQTPVMPGEFLNLAGIIGAAYYAKVRMES